MKRLYCGIIGGIILFSIGCQRDGSGISLLRLNIPAYQTTGATTGDATANSSAGKSTHKNESSLGDQKLGGLAISPLVHLVIVVRENSTQEIGRFTWDSNCDKDSDTATCSPPPPDQSFEVQRNVTYLIQVLAVYQDSTESLTFMYGDTVKTPQGAVDTAAIDIAAVGTSSNQEFRIGGRYLTASHVGPTGEIIMSYQPPGNSPAIPIMSETMVNGWFQLFTLPGAPFTYTLKETQLSLFADLDFSATAGSGINENANRMRISFPDSYRYDSGDLNYRLERGGEIIMGYFGPFVDSNSSDFKICYSATNASAYSQLFLDDQGATPLKYDGVAPYAANSLRPTTGTGGDNSSACLSGSESHKMKFDYLQFDGWAGSLFGFDSPYLHQDTGSGYYSVFKTIAATSSGSQTNVTIGWKYLPDVFNQGVSGTKLFLVQKPQLDNYELDHDIDCYALNQDAVGFSSVASLGVVTSFASTVDAGSGGQADLQIPDSWIQNDQAEMVICPFVQTAAGPDFIFQGKQSHGLYFDVPTATLNAKLVSSTIFAKDELYHSKAGLGSQSYSFLNDNFVGGFSKIYLLPFAEDVAGNGNSNDKGHRMIDYTDVDSADISFDSGATWIEIYSQCAAVMENFSSNQGNIFRMELSGLSTCSAVSAAWGNGSSDITIQIRIGLTNTAGNNYGLGGGNSADGPSYTTGSLVLKADSTCVTRAPALVKTQTPATAVPSLNFMSEFFNPNGTDVETEYQLAFTSSSNVCVDSSNGGRNLMVVLGSFNYPGMNCFSQDDFHFAGGTHPFSFLISPQDRTGADCTMDSSTFYFYLAGENAIYYSAAPTGSDIIGHSSVAAQLNPYLSANATPNYIDDRNLVLEQVFLSPGLQLGVFNGIANSDYQAVDRLTPSGAPTGANWDVNSLLVNTGLQSNPFILDMALAPTTPLGNRVSFSDAGLNGHFDLTLSTAPEDVIWIDEKSFRQGSPLILTKDLSNNNRVYYIPASASKLELVYGPFSGNLGHGGVTYYNDPNSGKNILVYSTGANLNYVALDHEGQVLGSNSRVLNSPKLIFDFKLTMDISSNEFLLATTEEGFNDGRIFYLNLSTYDEGSQAWNHPAPSSNVVVDETGFLLDCGGSQFLHGIWNANYSAIIPFTISSGSITGTTTTAHSWGDATGEYFGEYNRFGCTEISGEKHFIAYQSHALATGPSTGRIPQVFKGYLEGVVVGNSQNIISDNTVRIDVMEFIAMPGQLYEDLLVVSRPVNTSAPITIDLYTIATGITAYSYQKTIGSIPNGAAKKLNGFRKSFSDSSGDLYYLYGNLGQIYVFKLK